MTEVECLELQWSLLPGVPTSSSFLQKIIRCGVVKSVCCGVVWYRVCVVVWYRVCVVVWCVEEGVLWCG